MTVSPIKFYLQTLIFEFQTMFMNHQILFYHFNMLKTILSWLVMQKQVVGPDLMRAIWSWSQPLV